MIGKRRRNADVAGQVFNYLTVERMAGKDRSGRTLVECRCVCGTVKTLRLDHVRSGRVKSCGCMRGRLISDAVSSHGDSKPDSRYFPLYRVWVDMRHRTMKEGYQDTGVLVGVCDEWEDWGRFRDWSLSHGYAAGRILERLDKSEPYSPGNCRWIVRFDDVMGVSPTR